MSENTKTPRITKAMKFEDIRAILNGETQPNDIAVDVLADAMTHELELLAKKNAGKDGEAKLTPTQVKNEEYKTAILDIIAGNPDGVTCTEIHKAMTYDEPYEIQKTSSLCRQLKDAGKVVSEKVKGKTIFKLA